MKLQFIIHELAFKRPTKSYYNTTLFICISYLF